MSQPNRDKLKAQITRQIREERIRFTVHAHQEMVAENFSLDDVVGGLIDSELLENYPGHKRGACALFVGAGQSILFAQPAIRCELSSRCISRKRRSG